MKKSAILILFALSAFCPRPLHAQNHDHVNPDIARDHNGNYYITWLDAHDTGGTDGDVYLHGLDASGSTISGIDNVKVSALTMSWAPGGSWHPTPRVAHWTPDAFNTGRLYIIWARGFQDLMLQQFDLFSKNLIFPSEKIINVSEPAETIGYDLAHEDNGFTIVNFQRYGPSGRVSFAQKLDQAALPVWPNLTTPADVSSGQGANQTRQSVAVSEDNFVYMMNASTDGGNYLRRMDVFSNTIWHSVDTELSEFGVDTDDNNKAIVAGRDGNDVFLQRYDTDGNKEFVTPVQVSSGAQVPKDVQISVDPSRDYLVTWRDKRPNNGNDYEIYFNKVTPDGTRVFAQDIAVNSVDLIEQMAPRNVSDGNGGVFVVWHQAAQGSGGTTHIFANHIDGNGNRLFAQDKLINGDFIPPGANNPPVITSVPVTEFYVDVANQYQVTATDADNDPLTYAINTGPSGYTIDANTGLVTWNPGGSSVGEHPVSIQVSDGQGGITTQDFTLNVTYQPYKYVRIFHQRLQADFDKNGVYDNFFVKGIGYEPIPVGQFYHAPSSLEPWESLCGYVGPYPLNYPSLRFERDSPDAVDAFDCDSFPANMYQTPETFLRDFPFIQSMGANTVRTWGRVSPELLQYANAFNLKVIAGFWVDHGLDYTFPGPSGAATRQSIIDNFVGYIRQFKNDPAILMWGISNENNLAYCTYTCPPDPACDADAQAQGYYQLMNDMAAAAKAEEGAYAHPVAIVTAELTDDLKTHGPVELDDVDIIGINAYRGDSFDGYPNPSPNLFEEFQVAFPDHSMIVTEFGTDAWNTDGHDADPENGFEDQLGQSVYITSAWNDLFDHSVYASGPVNGGVVFHYTDSWRDAARVQDEEDPNDPCLWISSDWTPSVITHDHDFFNPAVFGPGTGPDDRANVEWWGLYSVEQNPDGAVCGTPAGIDCVTPRQVAGDLETIWETNHAPRIDPITGKIVYQSNLNGWQTWINFNAYDPDGDRLQYTVTSNTLPTASQGSFWYNANNDQWSYIPPADLPVGVYNIEIAVTDPEGLTASGTFQYTVVDCFIASAAYGTPMHDDIEILRKFRDEKLMANHYGRKFVNWYYARSPVAAEYIVERPALRALVRLALKPVIFAAEKLIGTDPASSK